MIECKEGRRAQSPAQKTIQNFYPKRPNYFKIFFEKSFSTQGIQAHTAFQNIPNPFAQMVWKKGMVFKSSEKYIRLRFK